MKYCANKYIEVARYMVSPAVARGKWKRAMGLKKLVWGQPLVAIIKPIKELTPFWAVVPLETIRSGVIISTWRSSYDSTFLQVAMSFTKWIATGQVG
jgi:hypothetical protein